MNRDWIKLIFSVLLSIFRNTLVIQDISTAITENVINVSSFYHIFGKIIEIPQNNARIFGKSFGILPEVIIKNKEKLFLTHKKKIFSLSIFAFAFYVISVITRGRLKALLNNQEKAVAVKGLRCLSCRVFSANQYLKPCNHLVLCDRCNDVACPKCGKQIERKIVINL